MRRERGEEEEGRRRKKGEGGGGGLEKEEKEGEDGDDEEDEEESLKSEVEPRGDQTTLLEHPLEGVAAGDPVPVLLVGHEGLVAHLPHRREQRLHDGIGGVDSRQRRHVPRVFPL